MKKYLYRAANAAVVFATALVAFWLGSVVPNPQPPPAPFVEFMFLTTAHLVLGVGASVGLIFATALLFLDGPFFGKRA